MGYARKNPVDASRLKYATSLSEFHPVNPYQTPLMERTLPTRCITSSHPFGTSTSTQPMPTSRTVRADNSIVYFMDCMLMLRVPVARDGILQIHAPMAFNEGSPVAHVVISAPPVQGRNVGVASVEVVNE